MLRKVPQPRTLPDVQLIHKSFHRHGYIHEKTYEGGVVSPTVIPIMAPMRSPHGALPFALSTHQPTATPSTGALVSFALAFIQGAAAR